MTVIYVSEAQNTNMAVQRANTFPEKLILIIQLGEYICPLTGGCPVLLVSFDTYSRYLWFVIPNVKISMDSFLIQLV